MANKPEFSYINWRTDQQTSVYSYDDLRDGKALNILVDKVFGINRTTWNSQPMNAKERKSNASCLKDFLKGINLFTHGLKTKDITDGSPRLKQLIESIFMYDLKRRVPGPLEYGSKDATTCFLYFINKLLPPQLKVHNFHDYWSSGKALAALVERFCPGSLKVIGYRDWEETDERSLYNIKDAMSAAQDELGIQQWIKPEDMLRGRAIALHIIIYLSQFLELPVPQKLPQSPGFAEDKTRTSALDAENRNFHPSPSMPDMAHQDQYQFNNNHQMYQYASDPFTTRENGLRLQTAVPNSYQHESNRRVTINPTEFHDTYVKPHSRPLQHSKSFQIPASNRSIHDNIGGSSPIPSQQSTGHMMMDSFETHPSRASTVRDSGIEDDSEQINHDLNPRQILFTPTTDEANFWKRFTSKEQNQWKTKLSGKLVCGDLLLKRNTSSAHNPVCEGRFEHPSQGYIKVAVKFVKWDNTTTLKDVQDALGEVNLMKNFQHPNLMSVIAMTFMDGRPATLMPLMKNGDLQSYLINNKEEIQPAFLLTISSQVASGMAYLHDYGFIHQNLITTNVLLDDKLNAVIYNFTFTRETYNDDVYRVQSSALSQQLFWWRCLAPEVLGSPDGRQRASTKSDAYSFGVLLWMLYTYGRIPFETCEEPEELRHYLLEGHTLSRPQAMPDAIFHVACNCWVVDPEQRPEFSKVTEYLGNDGYTSLNHYDNIDHFAAVNRTSRVNVGRPRDSSRQDRSSITQIKRANAETPV